MQSRAFAPMGPWFPHAHVWQGSATAIKRERVPSPRPEHPASPSAPAPLSRVRTGHDRTALRPPDLRLARRRLGPTSNAEGLPDVAQSLPQPSLARTDRQAILEFSVRGASERTVPSDDP